MVTFVDVIDNITKPPVSSVLAGVLAVLTLILTVVWVKTYQPCHWEGGQYTAFSTDAGGEGKFGGPLAGCVFNWHPVLMVASMVTGTTLAALCYHTPLQKTVTKPLHAAILFVSFILMCCGLRAVFSYHDNKVRTHELAAPLRRLHLTGCLFCCGSDSTIRRASLFAGARSTCQT
eukprot:COSAG06_NODE_2778_length_6298_cov_7.107437_6_plen_175_part_00